MMSPKTPRSSSPSASSTSLLTSPDVTAAGERVGDCQPPYHRLGCSGGCGVPETEPCPFCDGTGERLKPPPPLNRGYNADRTPGVRRHGYSGTYSNGCRCEACRAAWREASARWKARRREGAETS